MWRIIMGLILGIIISIIGATTFLLAILVSMDSLYEIIDMMSGGYLLYAGAKDIALFTGKIALHNIAKAPQEGENLDPLE